MWVLFDGGRFVAVVKYERRMDPRKRVAPGPFPFQRKKLGTPLLVRSRTRQDLADFLALSKLKNPGRIRSTPEADYPFRVIAPAWYVARCLKAAAAGMEYSSLKKSIGHDTPAGRLRYSVAVGAWTEIRRLEALNPPESSTGNPQVFHRQNPRLSDFD